MSRDYSRSPSPLDIRDFVFPIGRFFEADRNMQMAYEDTGPAGKWRRRALLLAEVVVCETGILVGGAVVAAAIFTH